METHRIRVAGNEKFRILNQKPEGEEYEYIDIVLSDDSTIITNKVNTNENMHVFMVPALDILCKVEYDLDPGLFKNFKEISNSEVSNLITYLCFNSDKDYAESQIERNKDDDKHLKTKYIIVTPTGNPVVDVWNHQNSFRVSISELETSKTNLNYISTEDAKFLFENISLAYGVQSIDDTISLCAKKGIQLEKRDLELFSVLVVISSRDADQYGMPVYYVKRHEYTKIQLYILENLGFKRSEKEEIIYTMGA